VPDWPSFGWGVVTGGVIAFWAGFFKKAGEALFTAVSARFKPPEPIQVDGKFIPNLFPPGSCAWVNELKLYEYEEQGYSYYPYGKRNARCFRLISDGPKLLKEFLMVKPGATKNEG
jgi:hypothetical protein